MAFDFANKVRLQIPEGMVKQIADSTGNVIWKRGYVNMVPLSTNPDGTVYNTTGYKYGYRIRSGGAEGTADNTACTGFIPAKGGDIVRVSGCQFNTAVSNNAINVSDATFTNIGQIAGNYADAGYGIFAASGNYTAYAFNSIVQEPTGVWKWTIPPDASIAYIRVTGYRPTSSGADLIITVNEEIE